jgi:UDP:flavonoid glycosyltransferase YjiC (YdhE family)
MRKYARSLGVPSVYGFSPSFLPRPADWDEFQHVTGYWFLEAQTGWQPPLDLLGFLESGPPPVYVGFGSMSPDNSEHLTRLALRALELSGQRGVLLTGWGGLRRLPVPRNVFFVDDVPHAWLFPRMAAVVHHGGAGTTASGLRAGVPSIIAPFGGDQCAWADLVGKSGLGPSAGPVQRLTPEKLANAIQIAINDSTMRARARVMGEKIRAENGIAQAIELVERYSGRTPIRDIVVEPHHAL